MRHRFHALCPYFAMFPEIFVEKHLAASKNTGVVFDPFCGRGTTLFQSLLVGREAAGCDVNPVAYVISQAKCDPPKFVNLIRRIRELRKQCSDSTHVSDVGDLQEFFEACYHRFTFSQILFLRNQIDWRRRRVDRFIAAMALGALHGESHRSQRYFSNRMPRTISTKPRYSINWWKKNGYVAPMRDVFEILEDIAVYRYRSDVPDLRADVRLIDARKAGHSFRHLKNKVSDVITSPPYLDTTNYLEDQWLRLWFLGEPSFHVRRRGDHRHTSEEKYWEFLESVWLGMAPLLGSSVRFVVRIGGRQVNFEDARCRLQSSISRATQRDVKLLDSGFTSVIKKNQSIVFSGREQRNSIEHDFTMCLSM